jgi:hypothetical protein
MTIRKRVTIELIICKEHLTALSDVLITAVEGGSNYWAHFKNYDLTEDENMNCLGVTVIDTTEDTEFKPRHITPMDLLNAVIVMAGKKEWPFMAKKCQSLLFDPENADIDASDADNILQVALFGDIIYS